MNTPEFLVGESSGRNLKLHGLRIPAIKTSVNLNRAIRDETENVDASSLFQIRMK